MAGGLYFAVYRILLGGELPADPVFRAVGMLCFFGVGSLVVLVADLLRQYPEEQGKRLPALCVGVTPLAFLVLMPLVLRVLNVSDPVSVDRSLFALDGRFGFQAGVAASRLFGAWPSLATLGALTYASLFLAMACVYLAAPHVPDEPGLLRTFLLTGIFGELLFHLLPAAGVGLNAFPSLHIAWALLIFWRTRRSGVGVRSVAGLFLLLTVAGTLGLERAYLIHIVVAVPFVVAVRALCITTVGLRPRLAVFCCTASMVAFWVWAVRSGVLLRTTPQTAWGLVLITVASSLWLDVGMGRYRLRLARKRLFPDTALIARFSQAPLYTRRRRQWASVL
jgi:hypothetical protein